MILYAESSAVLAWLLGEKEGERVRAAMIEADDIVSAELTLVECDRVIYRGAALGAIKPRTAADLRSRLAIAASDWSLLRMSPQIVARAREPFPEEPLRTLAALHMASALHARVALPAIALLSLDHRIRRVGERLGFALLPARARG